MTVGWGFINQMIEEQQAPSCVNDYNMDATSFMRDERTAYDFIVEYYVANGVLPTEELLEGELQIVVPEMPEGTLRYWAGKIRDRTAHNIITSGMQRIREQLANEEITEAKSTLQSIAIQARRSDIGYAIADFGEIIPAIIERHELMRQSGSIIGITFGFPFIDAMTGGAQPGDFIVIVGRPGAGKTYFLLHMALMAYLQGKSVIFVTNEMTKEQCASRLVGLMTGVTHSFLRRGMLSEFAIEQMIARLDEEYDEQRFKFIEGSMSGSLQDIMLRAREISPDVVYVDGAYLMSLSAGKAAKWEVVTDVASAMKRAAMEMGIPWFATYQQSRRAEQKSGGSLATIGYSDAIGQLATIGLDVADEDVDDELSFGMVFDKILSIIKGREGEFGSIRVEYNMRRMRIRQEEILTQREE